MSRKFETVFAYENFDVQKINTTSENLYFETHLESARSKKLYKKVANMSKIFITITTSKINGIFIELGIHDHPIRSHNGA